MGRPTLIHPLAPFKDVDELLAFHKALFGNARMEDPPPSDGRADPPAPPPPTEKTLSQTEVNDIVTRRTKEASEKAAKDFADQLGVPLEEAKRIIKERQEADEKNATDLQKAQKAQADAEADRDTKVTTAQRELHLERADRALVAAGIPDDDAKLARLRGMLTVEVGAPYEDVKKDVEKLKTDFPALFDAPPPPGTPPKPPGSGPKGSPPGGKVDQDAMQRGLDRAKAATSRQPGGEDGPRPFEIPGLGGAPAGAGAYPTHI